MEQDKLIKCMRLSDNDEFEEGIQSVGHFNSKGQVVMESKKRVTKTESLRTKKKVTESIDTSNVDTDDEAKKLNKYAKKVTKDTSKVKVEGAGNAVKRYAVWNHPDDGDDSVVKTTDDREEALALANKLIDAGLAISVMDNVEGIEDIIGMENDANEEKKANDLIMSKKYPPLFTEGDLIKPVASEDIGITDDNRDTLVFEVTGKAINADGYVYTIKPNSQEAIEYVTKRFGKSQIDDLCFNGQEIAGNNPGFEKVSDDSALKTECSATDATKTESVNVQVNTDGSTEVQTDNAQINICPEGSVNATVCPEGENCDTSNEPTQEPTSTEDEYVTDYAITDIDDIDTDTFDAQVTNAVKDITDEDDDITYESKSIDSNGTKLVVEGVLTIKGATTPIKLISENAKDFKLEGIKNVFGKIKTESKLNKSTKKLVVESSNYQFMKNTSEGVKVIRK